MLPIWLIGFFYIAAGYVCYPNPRRLKCLTIVSALSILTIPIAALGDTMMLNGLPYTINLIGCSYEVSVIILCSLIGCFVKHRKSKNL